jgi:glycosyltransferase involved in cell wall biosynthesis
LLLITPARNEADLIQKTITAVVAQTVPPVRWIIVSDGSTDGTDEMVTRFARQHSWIELFRLPEQRDRQFAAKAHAFNAGLAHAAGTDYDLVGNLDADITFERDYLEFLIRKFTEDPDLGVCGTPFVEDFNNTQEHTYGHHYANLEHVSGACQIFRRECFSEIGGYVPIRGGAIDWIAVTTARMNGWKTRTFPEKVCFHHRKLGTGTGKSSVLRMRFHYGQKAYYVGGLPAWETLRGVFQMRQKPYVLGGAAFICGFLLSAIRRIERPVTPQLMKFHRGEQLGRLRRLIGLS